MLLAHDVMAHARAADARGRCRREAPLTWCADDGALVEGAVDLAFEDEDGWCVLDFKTDQAIEAQLEVYRRQVAIYAHVIALATGRPARGVLVQL
jgi:ATP-dependent exoDNAse (exonuclease V) beta subunit